MTVLLAMVGKLGSAAAFAVIYVFSSELFPTVIRHSATGASSSWARVGGMIAPYIVDWVRGVLAPYIVDWVRGVKAFIL